MKLLASATIAGSLVAGCAKIASNDVKTSGMTADITAVADGTGTTSVGATLYVGDPANLDFVMVDAPDSLFAEFGTEQQAMALNELGNIVSYSASFGDDTEGDQFTVDFSRASGDVQRAELDVRDAFAAPRSRWTRRRRWRNPRAADLMVMWTSADDPNPMQWNASGDCIDAASGSITVGASTVTISANTLIQAGSAEPTSCTITVTIQRNEMGTLDPAFGGGGVVGIQQRSFELTGAIRSGRLRARSSSSRSPYGRIGSSASSISSALW